MTGWGVTSAAVKLMGGIKALVQVGRNSPPKRRPALAPDPDDGGEPFGGPTSTRTFTDRRWSAAKGTATAIVTQSLSGAPAHRRNRSQVLAERRAATADNLQVAVEVAVLVAALARRAERVRCEWLLEPNQRNECGCQVAIRRGMAPIDCAPRSLRSCG
jgi:hypothetical protein